MAYYAQILDNLVTQVIVVSDDIPNGTQFCTNLLGGQWVQTYAEKPNKNFASIGFTYDAVNDNFIAPQPYPSWTLDSNDDWQPPTPKPDGMYSWDEAQLEWVLIQ